MLRQLSGVLNLGKHQALIWEEETIWWIGYFAHSSPWQLSRAKCTTWAQDKNTAWLKEQNARRNPKMEELAADSWCSGIVDVGRKILRISCIGTGWRGKLVSARLSTGMICLVCKVNTGRQKGSQNNHQTREWITGKEPSFWFWTSMPGFPCVGIKYITYIFLLLVIWSTRDQVEILGWCDGESKGLIY